MRRFFALLSLAATVFATSAIAQEDLDLDDDGRKSERRVRQRDFESEIVREIERGYFVKANAGTTMYLNARRGILRPGTTLNLTVGGDFLDKEKISAAWELTLYQGLHNGMPFQEQGDNLLGPDRLIQGDIHTFAAMVGAEVSGYPLRRFGIGARLGGGVMFVPILMDRGAYDEEVVGLSQGEGAWGGPQNDPAVHRGPKPVIYVGPTFEYYTKLSHFSFGADIDVFIPIGLDIGLCLTGYVKYTF